MMRFLLGHGASTNTRDRFNKRPLETAYHRSNLQAIKLLLECGADADLRDTYDWTPLHYASYHGQLDIVLLLLRYGADVDSKARKTLDWTPLHGASSQGHLTIVKELVDGGADVNAQDAAQHTPISIALRTGRSGVVEILRGYMQDEGDQTVPQPSPEQPQWHRRAMEIISGNDIEVWWVVAIIDFRGRVQEDKLDLGTHPFTAILRQLHVLRCRPSLISDASADHRRTTEGDENYGTAWSIVNILFSFSSMLVEESSWSWSSNVYCYFQPFSPANVIFAVSGMLFVGNDFAVSYNALVDLFERLGNSLRPLEIYIGIPRHRRSDGATRGHNGAGALHPRLVDEDEDV
ncbi:ankyrin repeat-containing domain protein [Russula brevipes]|nr:ankyrin repeat-containing domain protein [Russula brevipes]